MRLHAIGSRTLAIAALAVAPLSLQAQHASGHTMSADDRALHSYTLTMDHLRKLKQVALELTSYAKAHPDEAQNYEDMSNSDDATLDQQVARLESIPPMRKALSSAGMSARDYILTSLTFFQAAMTAGMMDSYAKTKQPPPALPYNVNPANVAFVRAHKAEIEQLKLGEVNQAVEQADAPDSSDSSDTTEAPPALD